MHNDDSKGYHIQNIMTLSHGTEGINFLFDWQGDMLDTNPFVALSILVLLLYLWDMCNSLAREYKEFVKEWTPPFLGR